jgi:hypothetical protein
MQGPEDDTHVACLRAPNVGFAKLVSRFRVIAWISWGQMPPHCATLRKDQEVGWTMWGLLPLPLTGVPEICLFTSPPGRKMRAPRGLTRNLTTTKLPRTGGRRPLRRSPIGPLLLSDVGGFKERLQKRKRKMASSTKSWRGMADLSSFLLNGREVPPCTVIVIMLYRKVVGFIICLETPTNTRIFSSHTQYSLFTFASIRCDRMFGGQCIYLLCSQNRFSNA